METSNVYRPNRDPISAKQPAAMVAVPSPARPLGRSRHPPVSVRQWVLSFLFRFAFCSLPSRNCSRRYSGDPPGHCHLSD